jgi:serine protease AprX
LSRSGKNTPLLGYLVIALIAATPLSLGIASAESSQITEDKSEYGESKISSSLQAKIAAGAPNQDLPVIVFLKKNGEEAAASYALARVSSLVMNSGGMIKHSYRLIRAVSATVPADKVKGLAEDPLVEHIYYDESVSLLPDPGPGSGGAQAVNSPQTIGATYAWDTLGYTGAGIKIAIVDSGVNYSHPDLGGGIGTGYKVIDGYDFVNEDPDPMDDNGHGTHVAGIAAANGSLKGVAPDAEILAVKVLNSAGVGTTSDIIAGIDWSVSKGAHIISMSIGGVGRPNDEFANPITIATDAAVDKGVVVVVAAGNEGPGTGGINILAAGRKVITVGASDSGSTVDIYDDTIASFSNRGPSAFGRLDPEVVAPGVNINSTSYTGGYVLKSGTSMATPHVSGAAALLLQKNTSLSPLDVRRILMHTSSNLTSSGIHVFEKGAGIINVSKALLYNISATINGDDRWEEAVLPGFNATAKLMLANHNSYAVNLTLKLEGASDLEGDNTLPLSSFSFPGSVWVQPGRASNVEINFTAPMDAKPAVYGATLVVSNDTAGTIRIPIVITLPLVGDGVIRGTADNDEYLGDWIYYMITAHNGTSINATLSWSGGDDLDLYLFAPNGETINFSNTPGNTREVTSSDLVYPEHWLAVDVDTITGGGVEYNLTVRYPTGAQGGLQVQPSAWQGTVPRGIYNVTFSIINDATPKQVNLSVRILRPGDSNFSTGSINNTGDEYSIVAKLMSGGLNTSNARYLNASLQWDNTSNDLDLALLYFNGTEWMSTRYVSQHNNSQLNDASEKLENIDIRYYLRYDDVGIGVKNLGDLQSYNLTLNLTDLGAWPAAWLSETELSLSSGEQRTINLSVNGSALSHGRTYSAFLVIQNATEDFASVPLKINPPAPAPNISISGYTLDVNGTPLNATNVTVHVYTLMDRKLTPIGSYTNLSDAGGYFIVSVPMNRSYFYSTVIRHYNNSRVVQVGQYLPPLPLPAVSSLGSLRYYLKEAAALNITAFNQTGAQVSFRYSVKDLRLGYPVAEELKNHVSQTTVYVPADRNYSITIYPYRRMPVSYTLDNISAYGFAPVINVTFNLAESLKRVHGYVSYNNTAGFDYLRVVPYHLEPGDRVHRAHPIPYNMSQSDHYNASTGFYNITLRGSAMQTEMLLFFTARNTSGSYFGAFQNLTLNASSDDLTLNLSLQPLLGAPANITLNNGANLSQTVNVSTAMARFRLQNLTGSVPRNAHVEFTVDYSAIFNVTRFTWIVELQTGSEGNFTLPVVHHKVHRIHVYTPDFAPLKTSLTAGEVLADTVLINMSSFSPGGVDEAFTDIAISIYRSNSTCDVPYPPEGCSLSPAEKNLRNFNPLSLLIGGGDISLRMRKQSNNITVHYRLVDLLASGPPDAVFDGNASTSRMDGYLAEAWRFGSTGPEIYEDIIIGVPYNETITPDTYEFNVTIGAFYDEGWDTIWNISVNSSGEIPVDYQAYLQPRYAGYVNGSGMKCSKTDPLSICYVNTSTDMVWLRVPHFSGVGPLVHGSDVMAPTVTISSPLNKTYYNSSVYLNLSRSDDTGVASSIYSVDGGTNKSYTGPLWVTGLSNGSHSIEVFTNDTAGNLNITRIYFSLDYINESVSRVVNASANWSNVSTSLVFINITTSTALVGSVNISTYAAPPPGVNESLMVQRYIEVNVSSNLNASSGNLSWAYIRVNYTDSEVTGLDEPNLRLYWWNPAAKNWTMLETGKNLTALGGPHVYDSGVNTSGNYVYANISHFSIYGISGPLYTPSPTPSPTTVTAGGGGGGGISINASDLAYFREIFKLNTLVLVPSRNVSEDWEAAMAIKEWFRARGYSIEVKLVSQYNELLDEGKRKIFIGGHMANPYSAELGIGEHFSREADNMPWLVNGEPWKGVIRVYLRDPLSYTRRGNTLVIAGADRKQTIRITREFLSIIEKEEKKEKKTNLGPYLVL